MQVWVGPWVAGLSPGLRRCFSHLICACWSFGNLRCSRHCIDESCMSYECYLNNHQRIIENTVSTSKLPTLLFPSIYHTPSSTLEYFPIRFNLVAGTDISGPDTPLPGPRSALSRAWLANDNKAWFQRPTCKLICLFRDIKEDSAI